MDKLKQFAEGFKEVLFYILAPLFFVAGFIYYLVTQNTELKTELKAKQGEEKLNELQGQQEQVDSGASDAVSNFEKLRSQLPGSSGGGGESDSGPKGAA